MKTYNKTNFFKHTFCKFTQVDNFQIPENTNYKSKSESMYFYTDEGVYRKSNHWGRVANCRWKLIANEDYKNQQIVIGFAKWNSFYPINSTEKIFFIAVNFEEKTANILPKKEDANNIRFTLNEAQQKVKQISILFKETKWANYFEDDIDTMRFKVITEFVNTNKTLQEIKLAHK
ncbi:hypothetical protein [Polaribacter sp. L3A8]|uniref:hypothetical protein n=1 Tax=Polaribacter sp. L3A8 TaxID=2686361 RepID=UPI00131AAA59|nr:hypothetical protein [Polaribacter sp. L3A8]